MLKEDAALSLSTPLSPTLSSNTHTRSQTPDVLQSEGLALQEEGSDRIQVDFENISLHHQSSTQSKGLVNERLADSGLELSSLQQ